MKYLLSQQISNSSTISTKYKSTKAKYAEAFKNEKRW